MLVIFIFAVIIVLIQDIFITNIYQVIILIQKSVFTMVFPAFFYNLIKVILRS